MSGRLTITFVAGALALAGCGGGGGGGGKLSSDDLASKESARCEKTASVYADANNGAITSQDEAVAYLDKLAPAFDSLVADLRKLEPPDEIKAKWDAFMAAQTARAKAWDAGRRAAHADPSQAAQQIDPLNKLVGPGSPSDRAQKALGVDFICI